MLNSWIKHRPLIGATTRHGQAGCLASDAVVLPVSNAQIRLAYNDDELKQAARLRAEAYYENENYGRFTQSFIRQFAEKEYYSLKRRTSEGKLSECLALIAITGEGSVEGSIDIRPPSSVNGRAPQGVPLKDAMNCAYILNLVVSESSRRMKIGKTLIKTVQGMAFKEWKANGVYAHVEAHNEAALALYTSCGFTQICSDTESFQETHSLGRNLLLKCILT